MKKKLFRKILLLCALVTISLLGRTHAQAGVPTCTQASASAHEVKASNYADFLNQVATVSDPHFFYDEQMATDPEAACIVRVGAPGRWHYEVIAGRENFPVRYVNHVGKNAYSAWSENRLQARDYRLEEELTSCDASLKSNTRSFEVETTSAPTLSLAVDSFSRSNDSRFSSNEKCYFAIATGLAFAAFGHELMMKSGGEDVVGVEGTRIDDAAIGDQNTELSIEDFKQALADNPDTARFVIIRDDTGQASLQAFKEDATRGKNRSENMLVTAALRTALASEHPGISVEDLLSVHPMMSLRSYPSLSAQKLSTVFERMASTQTSLAVKQMEQQERRVYFLINFTRILNGQKKL